MPFRRLYQYQALAIGLVPIVPVVAVGDVLCSQSDVIFTKSFQYQSFVEPVLVPTVTPTVSLDWLNPLSEPVRQKPGTRASAQQTTAFVPLTGDCVFDNLAFQLDAFQTCPPITIPVAFSEEVMPSYPKAIIYQAFVEPPRVAPETVTVDKWVRPFSIPVPPRRFLAAEQQAAAFVPVVTVTPPAAVGDVLTTEESVFSRRTLLYQSIAEPVRFGVETVTVDKWFKSLADPVRKKPDFRVKPQVATVVAPEAILESAWHQPWSEPVRSKAGLRAQYQQPLTLDPFPRPGAVVTVIASFSEPVRVKRGLNAALQQSFTVDPKPEAVLESKWHEPWSEPTRLKGLRPQYQQFFVLDPFPLPPVATSEDRWHQPWSEPVRVKLGLRPSLQQAFATDPKPEAVLESKWHQPWSEPTRPKGLKVQYQQALTLDPFPRPPVATTEDQWHQAWSEPVRLKRGLSAALQLQPVTDPKPEPVLESKWHQAWSEPVRVRQSLRTGDQQYEARWPFPLPSAATVANWHQWWSEPVRVKVGLKPQLQQFIALDPFPRPSVFTTGSWYRPLSEPVRIKQGLKAALQQSFTIDPFILTQPQKVYINWFQAWSEPVRLKVGEKAWHQQFFIWAQPGKDFITIRLAATETADTMSGRIVTHRGVNSADVSVSEVRPQYANVSSAYAEKSFADVGITTRSS